MAGTKTCAHAQTFHRSVNHRHIDQYFSTLIAYLLFSCLTSTTNGSNLWLKRQQCTKEVSTQNNRILFSSHNVEVQIRVSRTLPLPYSGFERTWMVNRISACGGSESQN